MNPDRTVRRYRILVEIFYAAKSRHLGLDRPLKPGRFCEQNMRQLIEAEQATFVEVKQAMTWVFVTDRTRHWADQLVDIAGFAKAYRTICDQLDAHMPTPPPAAHPAAGGPRDGADHIASAGSKAEAEARFAAMTGEAPTLSVVPAPSSPHKGDDLEREVLARVAEIKKKRVPMIGADRKDLQ